MIDKIVEQKNLNLLSSNAVVEDSSLAPVLDNVPVGQNSLNNKNLVLLDKFKLTPEEFNKLMLKYPDFLILNETKQFIIVNDFLCISSDNVSSESKKNPESENIESQQSTNMNSVKSDESTNNFAVKEKFDSLNIEDNYSEKKQILIDEIIKNDFLYGEPKHTEDEWNALLNDKTKYNAFAQNKIASFETSIEDVEKSLENKTKSVIFNYVMYEVQSANRLGISLKEFKDFAKDNPDWKAEQIYDYLCDLKFASTEGKYKMAPVDEFVYNGYKIQIEAANYYALKNGENDSNVCLGGALEYFKKNNINPAVARYEYVKAVHDGKVDISSNDDDYAAKIDKEYNSYQMIFKGADSDTIKKILSKVESNGKSSEPTQIIKELLLDDKYCKLYNDADSVPEKTAILRDYLVKKYGSNVYDPQVISELQNMKNDAIASGDIQTAMVLQGYATYNENYARNLASSDNVNDQVTNSLDMASLGENAPVAIEKMETAGNLYLLIMSQKSLGENQKVEASKSYLYSNFSDVRLGVVEIAVGANPENQCQINDLTNSEEYNGKTDVRNSILKNVGNMHSSNKCYIFDSQTADKNAVLLNTASTVYCDLNKEDQVWGAQITRERSADLSETERNSIELNIATTIVKADKDNQVELHKYMSDSEFDSVQEQLGENICLYHKDNQADAFNITMQYGNETAIESAIANYDKMVPEAQVATQESYEVKSAEIETKYTEQVASDYAKNKDIQGKGDITNPKLTKEQRIEQAKERFRNASPNEKYAMLVEMLDRGVRKDAFQKLVKYCPTLLLAMMDMLVRNGQGQMILNTIGKSSEVTYKVVHLMMLKGSDSDKKIAAKYVLDSPSLFPNEFVEMAKIYMNIIPSRDNVDKKRLSVIS